MRRMEAVVMEGGPAADVGVNEGEEKAPGGPLVDIGSGKAEAETATTEGKDRGAQGKGREDEVVRAGEDDEAEAARDCFL